ncbi:MAG TPA: ATP-binding protein [Gammaproteobacteria bacterium]
MSKSGSIELSITGGLEDVRLLGIRVRAIARALVSTEQAALVELCTVEVANNCMEHAYEGAEGGAIDVTLRAGSQELVVEVRDRGRPIGSSGLEAAADPFGFDPTDIELLPEGGMGLALIRASVSRYEYAREGDCNVTRLHFPLDDAGSCEKAP